MSGVTIHIIDGGTEITAGSDDRLATYASIKSQIQEAIANLPSDYRAMFIEAADKVWAREQPRSGK